MQKPKTPPHPTRNIECKDCCFWHPDTVEIMVFMPGSQQPIPLSALRQQGQIAPSSATQVAMSFCFLNPQWVLTADISYCSNWVSNPKNDTSDFGPNFLA